MEQREKQDLISSTQEIIKQADSLLEELKEMKNGVEFLINEYHTNKRYFRLEPGRCTTEDVIKTVFEFAWSASRNYMSQQNKNS